LQAEVKSLLAALEQADKFLEGPPTAVLEAGFGVPPSGGPADGPAQGAAANRAPAEKPGERIGRYKLLEQVGEGGMGTVWMAEQEEPVRRRVALKIIKLGMDTRQVIARFEAERQALALMDHPNIAKVHDGGATEAGRPYFVMELVRGVRMTEYCDEHKLSVRERLALFVQVCQAVQHAHQKGIIHRDLKPSNILVTLHDGVPVPKVIDFGIAKATDQKLTDKTVFTGFHALLGTPAYMSPEQAEMGGLDIDTRSDIYSLGVVLYELLTGQTPFDAKQLLLAGLDAMRRTIREQEPERRSMRMGAASIGLDSPPKIHPLPGLCQLPIRPGQARLRKGASPFLAGAPEPRCRRSLPLSPPWAKSRTRFPPVLHACPPQPRLQLHHPVWPWTKLRCAPSPPAELAAGKQLIRRRSRATVGLCKPLCCAAWPSWAV
jgi:serine/threonine protein kinase